MTIFFYIYLVTFTKKVKKNNPRHMGRGRGSRPVAFTQTMGGNVNVLPILCRNTCVNVRIIIRLPNVIKVFMSLNT